MDALRRLEPVLRNRKVLVGGTLGVLLLLELRRRLKRAARAARRRGAGAGALSPSSAELSADAASSGSRRSRKKQKFTLAQFTRDLKPLLRIIFPRVFCRASILLGTYTGLLAVRTILSLFVSKLQGNLVKAVVQQSRASFLSEMVKWMGIAVPATLTNSLIRYFESEFSLSCRTSLVEHILAKYMNDDLVYYKIGQLDSRVSHPDQVMTEDVQNWCSQVVQVYSQVTKPVVDIWIMTFQLYLLSKKTRLDGKDTRSVFQKLQPTIFSTSVVILTGFVLSTVTPKFGVLAKEQAKRDGELRQAHARLIKNVEEVAFYRGHEIEHATLWESFMRLYRQMSKIFRKRIAYTMIQQFILKYFWSATGMVFLALPAFQLATNDDVATSFDESALRTQNFVESRAVLLDLAEAWQRVLSAYPEIRQLSGYTDRLTEMLTVFKDLAQAKYAKQLAEGVDPDIARLMQKQVLPTEAPRDAGFELRKVPLITPTGQLLLSDVTLRVAPGDHLMVVGPNGCGKSSLFRVLSGLWPVYAGSASLPKAGDVFFCPQQPYFTMSTLLEQVIYPQMIDDFPATPEAEARVRECLRRAFVNDVAERDGLRTPTNWMDKLSGGEKQRLALARMFYNRPRFAIFDECTSQVSSDVEGQLYEYAKDVGITLLTTSHRPTLWKFHKHVLRFAEHGEWEFDEIDQRKTEQANALLAEKRQLEADLQDVPAMRARYHEIVRTEAEVALSRPASSANLLVEAAAVLKK